MPLGRFLILLILFINGSIAALLFLLQIGLKLEESPAPQPSQETVLQSPQAPFTNTVPLHQGESHGGILPGLSRLILGLLLFISLGVSLWFWLAFIRPLQTISSCLQNRNSLPLKALTSQKNELGQLARLISKSFDQQEKIQRLVKEKQSLMQNLHDHLIQRLFACGLQIDAIHRETSTGNTSQKLSMLRDEINALLLQVREHLQPAASGLLEGLPPQAFQKQLQHWIETLETSSGIPFTFTWTDGMGKSLTASQADHLLGILREATANAVKHAGASEIQVEVTSSGREILFLVSDNGKGFTPEKSTCPTRHLGLENMRQRALACGAALNIQTSTGSGTTIKISLPLPF